MIPVVAGLGIKRRSPVEIVDQLCPHCGGGGLTYHLVHRYAHFMFIPIAPYAKVDLVECPVCQEVDEGAYPKALQGFVESERKRARPPRYLFAWFYIVAIALIVFVVASWRSTWSGTWSIMSYLDTPQKGDLYIVDTRGDIAPVYEYNYTILRIVSIDADSTWVASGSMLYREPADAERAIDAGDINDADYFMSREKMARADLLHLHDGNRLRKIVRP